MSKTPEELCKEWVNTTFNESDLLDDEKTEPTALEAYKTISQVAYLAGYKAAQETYKVAIETFEEVAQQMMNEVVQITSSNDQEEK